MDLGDPDFLNLTRDVAKMLLTPFADKVWQRILDNTMLPPGYYLSTSSSMPNCLASTSCSGHRSSKKLINSILVGVNDIRWSQLRDHGTSHLCEPTG